MNASWFSRRSRRAEPAVVHAPPAIPIAVQLGVHCLDLLDASRRRRCRRRRRLAPARRGAGAWRASFAVVLHFELQVRTEDAGVDHRRVARPSVATMSLMTCGVAVAVRPGPAAGRACAIASRRLGERRAEIVAPLRDAMRFVDDDEVDVIAGRWSRGTRRRSAAPAWSARTRRAACEIRSSERLAVPVPSARC